LVIKSTSFDDVLRVVIGVDGASDYKRSIIDLNLQSAAGNVILVELDYPRRTPQALK
jgi:hypothetical protein